MRKICIFTNYNLYGSKRYFSTKFAEALNRHGIRTIFIDTRGDNIELFFDQVHREAPDLACSFNSTLPYEQGHFFWDKLKLPFLSLVVDPIFYYQELMNSPLSIISCVDRSDYELVRAKGFEHVLFLPHAVERELHSFRMQSRPYEVVLMGSSYDPDALRTAWEQKYDRKKCRAIENAIQIGFSDHTTPFWEASLKGLESEGIDQREVDIQDFVFFVDHFMRGQDRLELVRSIKHTPVHVFGGKSHYEGIPVKGWEDYLSKMPNVVLHPPVRFEESLEIFKRSKICLNSVPSFKNGSHERIFISLACGCLPITTESQYIRENFVENEEIIFYRFDSRKEVSEKIQYYLNHETERQATVGRGREKVMQHHTWDVRVQSLVAQLPSILLRICS